MTAAQALTLALLEGQDVIVNLLLELGADVDLRDADGTTALMLASEAGNVELLQRLIAVSGADVNATREDGTTALMTAASVETAPSSTSYSKREPTRLRKTDMGSARSCGARCTGISIS